MSNGLTSAGRSFQYLHSRSQLFNNKFAAVGGSRTRQMVLNSETGEGTLQMIIRKIRQIAPTKIFTEKLKSNIGPSGYVQIPAK